MCESILNMLSIFTFFSGITYEILLRRGSFETKKKKQNLFIEFDADLFSSI